MKKIIWITAVVAVVTSLSTALAFGYAGLARPVVKVEQISGTPVHRVLLRRGILHAGRNIRRCAGRILLRLWNGQLVAI